jgi:hypothetical protein
MKPIHTIQSYFSNIHFNVAHPPTSWSSQWSHVYFRKMLIFGEKLLVPRPTPKLEDHPLSAVRDCLFNIFAAALHDWRTPLPVDFDNYDFQTKGYHLKNFVFSDVAPCRSCVNRRFGWMHRLHLQFRRIRERTTSVNKWLQPSAHADSSLEAIRSSETSVHIGTTRRHIPENDILHSHRRENLKSWHHLILSW